MVPGDTQGPEHSCRPLTSQPPRHPNCRNITAQCIAHVPGVMRVGTNPLRPCGSPGRLGAVRGLPAGAGRGRCNLITVERCPFSYCNRSLLESSPQGHAKQPRTPVPSLLTSPLVSDSASRCFVRSQAAQGVARRPRLDRAAGCRG